MIRREKKSDGTLKLSSPGCTYTFQKPKPGMLVLVITGKETGDLGRAPLGEVAAETALHTPLHLFIDMTGLSDVATTVSDDWTAWFRANRKSLKKVDVLASSVFVRLTVAVSQMFSGMGSLIQIHDTAEGFENARQSATGYNVRRAEIRGAGPQR